MIAPSASSSGGRLPSRRRRRRRSGGRPRWRSIAWRPWRAPVSSTGPRGKERRGGRDDFFALRVLSFMAALVVDSGSGMLAMLVFLVTFFALCFLRSSAGLRCPASWPVWTRRIVVMACTRLVLLVTMHFALSFFPGSQAQVARHLGRCRPEGQLQWNVQGCFCW